MNAPESRGPIRSLRALADNLLGSLRDRIALLSLEVEEERARLLVTFVWISAAMIAAAMALMFGSVTIVYLFWETAPLAVLGSLTAVYTGILIAVVISLRRHLTRQPRPFAATMAEIEEDRATLREEP